MIRATTEYNSDYRRDINSLFKLFVLPRMESNSRENTGFWDTVDSNQFGHFLLDQVHINIRNIIRNQFEYKKQKLLEPVDDVLGNYMGGDECLTVTFYAKNRHSPIGVSIQKEFTEGKKIATIQRGGERPVYSEPDQEMFDWLYGTYTQGKTDIHGDFNHTMSLSIHNARDYVDYSVKAEDYNPSVRDWHNDEHKETGIVGKIKRTI